MMKKRWLATAHYRSLGAAGPYYVKAQLDAIEDITALLQNDPNKHDITRVEFERQMEDERDAPTRQTMLSEEDQS